MNLIHLEKEDLFMDFDNTQVNSNKAFCCAYNILYKGHKNFKEANWENIKQYNFRDECPLIKNTSEIFEHELFFKHLEFIDHDMKEVLRELSFKYNITDATIGTNKNIALKSMWIDNNLPFIENVIYIKNKGCKLDKSMIDMKRAYFVDDMPENLISTNAKYKICFNPVYEWNKNWNGLKVYNSLDLMKILL